MRALLMDENRLIEPIHRHEVLRVVRPLPQLPRAGGIENHRAGKLRTDSPGDRLDMINRTDRPRVIRHLAPFVGFDRRWSRHNAELTTARPQPTQP